MKIDPQQFNDELEECGGDLGTWIERKERENRTFVGLEINPEKEKRLNYIKELCRQLHMLDNEIEVIEAPFTQDNRNGMAHIILPYLFEFSERTMPIMAKLYAAADFATMSCPYCIYDEEIDGDDVPKKEIAITFHVLDMWKTFGKGPFGV